MTSTINKCKLILRRLTPEMLGDVQVLYHASSLSIDLPKGAKLLSFNTFIKNLQCFAMMNSLESTPIPELLPTDSNSQKIMKAMNTEWNSKRKILNLWLSNDSSDWLLCGQISLYRTEGYPYRIYALKDILTDNLAFELGSDGYLGMSITDTGEGYIALSDIAHIQGSIVEEYSFQENGLPPNYVNYSFNSISTAGQKIINARPERRGYQITNTHATVPLRLSHAESSPIYSIILQPGQFYPTNYDDELYEGSVWVAGLGATSSCVAFEKV